MSTHGRHAEPRTVEMAPVAVDPVNSFDPVDSVDGVDSLDDVDLLSDPFADDLSAELATRAPRRYATRGTAVLAGLVLAVGGFLVGAQVQKNYGTPAASASQSRSARSAAGSPFAAGGYGGQRQGGAAAQPSAAAANVTTGTVKMVDGTTVYVQTADGNLVTVRTSGSTAVQLAQSGKVSDLTPGAQVSVEGPTSGDGTVTATKVTKGQ